MEANELAFFGKIAAGVTHELKNVLAIINESNGLMSDLLAMAKDSPMPHRDRFLRSVSKIEDQVRRGVEITSRFNRFAHSVDHRVASVDLNEVLDQTVGLAQRFARLKNIEIKAARSPGPIFITIFPFRLQMALTRAIEACIGLMGALGAIVLRVGGGDGPPRIEFRCETATGEGIELGEGLDSLRVWGEFENTAALLQAVVELNAATGGFSIVFSAAGRDASKVAG
ncbi:MAG: hypothetical protein WAW37_07330 [Syntrophobacteraceae bacterium]